MSAAADNTWTPGLPDENYPLPMESALEYLSPVVLALDDGPVLLSLVCNNKD